MTPSDYRHARLTDLDEHEADIELLRNLDGIYIGLLTPSEMSALRRLVVAGLAERDYATPAGFFLGLGKVKLLI